MKLIKALNAHLEEWLLVLLMSAEVIIVFWQVLARFVLKTPSAWSEEIARYMFIWLVWIGAAYATKENKHIKIDILSSKFKGTTKVIMDIITGLLFVALLVFMFFTSLKVTKTVYDSNSIATGSHMPMWIAWLSLPLSMFLMLFRFIQNTILGIINKKKEGEVTQQ